MESKNDAPVIPLINLMLTEAICKGASDVHIETFEHKLSVRYCADGAMNQLFEPPQQLATQGIRRIKVMARFDSAGKASSTKWTYVFAGCGPTKDRRPPLIAFTLE